MCMGVYASLYVHGGQKRCQVSFSVSLSLPFPLRHSLPESGARLFSARLKAKNPQASCLFLH